METIRPATESDRDWLFKAYLQMLHWLDGQAYLILPTEENARIMVGEFIAAISEGRSGIFIVEIGGQPAATLFWLIDGSPLQTRVRSAISWGQWVEPEFRGQSLVARMVHHAVKHFRALGVGEVLDMVHIPEADEAAKSAGFKTDPKIVVLKLDQ